MFYIDTLFSPTSSMKALSNPAFDILNGIIAATLFFVVFLGWAAFARLDAAAYAPGLLVVSGQRQSVQHRDGGVVGTIYVHEGQRVLRGQLLVTLTAAEVRAQERALASQALRLLAQRARLEAEQLGQSQITPPQEFSTLRSIDRTEAETAMKLQRTELAARVAVLNAQQGALDQRVIQSSQQGLGYRDEATSAVVQLRLIDEQIDALKPLAEKGFVSKTRVRDLERSRAELEGQRGLYAASVAQTRGAARESKIQRLEVLRAFRERTASDLRDVENNLGEIYPKWTAARDQLDRTKIRSPATGFIVGLTVFTPGGVISPGQKLMDIVPENAPLKAQVHIDPDDADDLIVGQKSFVRFNGLHERKIPDLAGYLTRLSADSFSDEKTGQNFYTGEITVPASQLSIINNVRGKNFKLRAGMPVQVLIPVRKRSALDYALEPLFGSFWSSFREH